jgi:hypothetical protein
MNANQELSNDGWYTMADLYHRLIESRSEMRKWFLMYESANTYIDKLKAIRLYYLMHEERIINHHKKDSAGWYDSYIINWLELFTPIEQDAWNSIRAKGRVVLYPQYPVVGYFLDFGNPYYKIGLELDGKKYHKKENDRRRDLELKHLGWTIYRITGTEMIKNDYKDFYDFEEWEWNENPDELWQHIRNWITGTGDGVIEAIKMVHFKPQPTNEFDHTFYSICQESLENHCLV